MAKRRAVDNSIEPKRPAFEGDDRFCKRFIIPTRYAGILIGKGGSVAKELRDEFKCDIFIPDTRGPERLLRVKSHNLEDIAKLMECISSKLATEMRRICNLRDNHSEIRLLVHKSQAGNIIGKGGETIKKLRDDTDCLIRMNQDCCPGSTERICQIAGTPPNIANCLLTVMQNLDEIETKGEMIFYDTNNFDEMRQYGGFKLAQVDPEHTSRAPIYAPTPNLAERGYIPYAQTPVLYHQPPPSPYGVPHAPIYSTPHHYPQYHRPAYPVQYGTAYHPPPHTAYAPMHYGAPPAHYRHENHSNGDSYRGHDQGRGQGRRSHGRTDRR